MKKLLISMLVLLFALAACTAEGTTIEETAETPTEVSLEPAPTSTDEPTAEPTATDVPTATPTSEPDPTETAEPEPTVTETLPQEEAPSGYEGTIPAEVELPIGSVVLFTQSGGFAGFDNTWVFYEDGRVTLNGADQTQLSPDRISKLVDDLEALSFFETSHITKPGDFCCDFFDYTLAVQTTEQEKLY